LARTHPSSHVLAFTAWIRVMWAMRVRDDCVSCVCVRVMCVCACVRARVCVCVQVPGLGSGPTDLPRQLARLRAQGMCAMQVLVACEPGTSTCAQFMAGSLRSSRCTGSHALQVWRSVALGQKSCSARPLAPRRKQLPAVARCAAWRSKTCSCADSIAALLCIAHRCSYDPVNQLAWFKLYDEVRVMSAMLPGAACTGLPHGGPACTCITVLPACSAAASPTTAMRTRPSSTWSGCPRRTSTGE